MSVHFKIEHVENDTFYQLLEALQKWCPTGAYFRAGIGVAYLSLCPNNDIQAMPAIENELVNFRVLGVRVVRQLCSKPKPERSFVGKWISLAEWKTSLSQTASN